MFSSSSSSSSPVASPRSWADVVRNSPSPPTTPRPPAPAVVTSPPAAAPPPVAAGAAATGSGAAGGAGGARETYFESDVQAVESSIELDGRKYTIEGVVTKYGDYLTSSGTTGAFIAGKDNTIERAERIRAGCCLINHLANRVEELKHNDVQLAPHIEVCQLFQLAL